MPEKEPQVLNTPQYDLQSALKLGQVVTDVIEEFKLV